MNEICKSSGCHYFDGFGCTRSGIVGDSDEKMPCDKGERAMRIGDKVWIPVSVIGTSDKGVTEVKYSCYSFWADNTDVQTVTAKDYRNALSKFHGMNAKERTEIWGLSFLSDALKVNAEDFVGRLRKYQSEPKTGQIWKSTNLKVVILKANELEVHYYVPSGKVGWCERNYFEVNFRNTGEALISIDAFLKDLEGLNEKG